MFISTLVAVKLHLCGVKHLHELLLTEHWRVGFCGIPTSPGGSPLSSRVRMHELVTEDEGPKSRSALPSVNPQTTFIEFETSFKDEKRDDWATREVLPCWGFILKRRLLGIDARLFIAVTISKSRACSPTGG